MAQSPQGGCGRRRRRFLHMRKDDNMPLLKNLTLVLCASALVIGLAACGGSVRKAAVEVVDTAAQQRADVIGAINMAEQAVAALGGVSTDAEVAAAAAAIAAARQAVTDADTLSSLEQDQFSSLIDRIDEDLADARDERRMAVGRLLAALGGPGIGDIDVVVRHGTAPTMAGTVSGTPPVAVTDLETEAVAGSALSSGGWNGGKYTADDQSAGTTDTVVLYTNIEAPGTQPFSGEMGKYSTANGLDSEGNLPIAADVDATLIAASAFPSGPGIRTHAAGPGGTVEVIGTFDAARGTYVCTPSMGSDCTSSVKDGGGFELDGGDPDGWKFVPAAQAEVVKRDDEYQYFGWWLRTVGSEYAFGAFHAGESGAADDFASLASLQGTATYRGPAAGMFAMQPQGAPATVGEFTAQATLEVDFGDSADFGTVEGTVDDFTVDGTDMPWSVTLGSARIGTGGGIAPDGSDMARTIWSIDGTNGAVPTTPPVWRGQLHDVNDEGVPGAVTGAFEAAYGEVGRMLGAFGTTR